MDNNFSKPPITNRGVEITSMPKVLEDIDYKHMLFDWFQCTIPYYDYSVYRLFYDLFGIKEDLILCNESGVFGYNVTYSYQNIKIMINNKREDMGFHILCSGSACRDIENLGLDFGHLFLKLSELGCHYTRVDVSVDVFKDIYFSVDKIRKCILNNEVVSKFRNSVEFNKTNLSNSNNEGLTIWFGSRASNIQVVFYNKLEERKSADVFIDSNVDFWQRLEVRFRDTYADSVIHNFLSDFDNFYKYYFGIVANYVGFYKYSATDVNRSRWVPYEWWSKFIEDSADVKLYRLNVEKLITNVNHWLDVSVSRSLLLSFLASVDVNNIDFKSYISRLKLGYTKLNTNDINFINDFRKEKNLDILDSATVDKIIRSL